MDGQQYPNNQVNSDGYGNPTASYAPSTQPQQPANQVNVNLDFQPPYAPDGTAAMSDGDKNLRLAAFIFMVIGLLSTCWAIIPLAWTIPMTVVSWGIYKGTRPNTTAFGVCSLIFVSLVAGILLLISTKDK